MNLTGIMPENLKITSTKLTSDSDVCPVCGGNGFILHKNKDGYEYATECSCNIEKRVHRYLQGSGVAAEEYKQKTFDSFKTDTDESKKMKRLAMRFLDNANATGIGYFGRSGSGKTHICIAICQELTKKRGIPHFYFSYRSEIAKLKALIFRAEDYEREMRKWQTCKCLYIDDLFKFAKGHDGQIQIQDLQIMFDIINARLLNRVITIFSSEMTVKEMLRIDEALASRIRQIVGAYGMKCEGKNRRM